MSLSPPIKRHGGKFYLADWIISKMPPHLTYCEPYAGGLQVLLKKRHEGVNEIVNDTDGWLMAFWNVMSSESLFGGFFRRLEGTPVSEEIFNNCLETMNTISPTDLAPEYAAYIFFVVARQSRQGLLKDFTTTTTSRVRHGMNEAASSWITSVDGLPDVHQRVRSVLIRCEKATNVIRQSDHKKTLHYLDPPYMPETRVSKKVYGPHEMTYEDHEQLLIQLTSIEGKFILSGYPSTLYIEYEKRYGWFSERKLTSNNSSSSSVKELKEETIWMNYNPAKIAAL